MTWQILWNATYYEWVEIRALVFDIPHLWTWVLHLQSRLTLCDGHIVAFLGEIGLFYLSTRILTFFWFIIRQVRWVSINSFTINRPLFTSRPILMFKYSTYINYLKYYLESELNLVNKKLSEGRCLSDAWYSSSSISKCIILSLMRCLLSLCSCAS